MATLTAQEPRIVPVELSPPAAKPPGERNLALDAYRGFVMLAMVSSGLGLGMIYKDAYWSTAPVGQEIAQRLGTPITWDRPTWGDVAFQFEHVEWEGCTFWDLIQPSFMFIVGAAMPYAFAKRRAKGESWSVQFGHVLRRAFLLCAIGILLDIYADPDRRLVIQFIRVLQQIAIGYVLAFLVLHLRPSWQALAAVLVLALHTGLYLWYGGSGEGGPWERDHNVGTLIDQTLHDWLSPDRYIVLFPLSKGGYVTLNALSSTATILFGVLAGELLMSSASSWLKLGVLILAGALGLTIGLQLMPWVPMVKRIWTASFAIYAAGWTCLMLAGFYLVIDMVKWRSLAFPFLVVGMNSIAIYVSAGVFSGNIRQLATPFVNPFVASGTPWQPVALAVLVVAGQWLFCYWLYRHKIFFKV